MCRLVKQVATVAQTPWLATLTKPLLSMTNLVSLIVTGAWTIRQTTIACLAPRVTDLAPTQVAPTLCILTIVQSPQPTMAVVTIQVMPS